MARAPQRSATRFFHQFRRREERRSTLTWPCEIPIGAQPADVIEIVQAYADWLASNDLPKLFVNAELELGAY